MCMYYKNNVVPGSTNYTPCPCNGLKAYIRRHIQVWHVYHQKKSCYFCFGIYILALYTALLQQTDIYHINVAFTLFKMLI